MTKQEEIREGTANYLLGLRYDKHLSELPVEGQALYLRQADYLLLYLHSQGVVIRHPSAILTWEVEPLIRG